jgi:hypothetical protein
MLVHMVAMKMVHVAVVQIVGMIVMHDGLVSALGAVCMVMSLMDGMLIHDPPPLVATLAAFSNTIYQVL